MQSQGYYVVGHCNLFCKRQKHTAPDIEKTTLQRKMQGRFFVLRTILSLHKYWIVGMFCTQSPWSRGHALTG